MPKEERKEETFTMVVYFTLWMFDDNVQGHNSIKIQTSELCLIHITARDVKVQQGMEAVDDILSHRNPLCVRGFQVMNRRSCYACAAV